MRLNQWTNFPALTSCGCGWPEFIFHLPTGLWNVNLGTGSKLNSYGKSLQSGSYGAKEALAKFAKLVEAESALVGAETLTELKGGFARVNSDMRKISRQLEETRVQT